MARAVRGETLPGTNADAELAEARVMAQASFMAACLVVTGKRVTDTPADVFVGPVPLNA